jgi:hypothetical protein
VLKSEGEKLRLPRAALEQFAEAAACMMYDAILTTNCQKNNPASSEAARVGIASASSEQV